jgi:hypothetical protein
LPINSTRRMNDVAGSPFFHCRVEPLSLSSRWPLCASRRLSAVSTRANLIPNPPTGVE